MEYLQDFFLERLEKTNVPQKESIFDFFKQYNNSKRTNFISSLEELENCENYDEVYYVDLSEDIFHEIPYQLLKCKNLKSLDLSSTTIFSIDGVGAFKKLEFLFLDDCEQLSKIPYEIGELKLLKGISLSNSLFNSLPRTFFDLTNLVYCDFGNNEFTNEILFHIEKLENLVELDINSNQMLNENGDTLVLKNLVHLELQNNNFEILPIDFSQCPLIEKLDISSNPIQTLPESIKTLSDLKSLNIDECLISNVPNLSSLSSCIEVSMGHIDMEKIPIEIFTIPSLIEFEITNSDIKELPEEIGNLSTLIRLIITDCQLVSLPYTIGELRNLEELVLRDNKINHLPPELGNLINLRELSLSNWNEGGNKVSKLPAWIGNLKSLVLLELDNIHLEGLPKEFGLLSNLSNLDLSGNPLDGLPLEFADLRKLKSLNLYGCSLDEMEEIMDMGIDELFEYLNKLRGVGKYSFTWELPESLRTAFQQYLNYFTDYVKKLEDFDINLEVLKTENGLRLKTQATNELTIEQIGNLLNDYIEYIKEDIEFSKTNLPENPNLELFRLQMETQINHFKQQVRQIEFENKYLRQSLDKLLEAQVNFSQAFQKPDLNFLTSSENSSNQEVEKIQKLISKNDLDKALNDLSLLVKQQYPNRLNEVVTIYRRLNNVKLDARIGTISYDQKQIEMNKIASSLLEVLQNL